MTQSGGFLLITFLPNQFSYTEFVSRNLLKRSWHRRLYTKGQLKTKLLEHGFDPVKVDFHQFLPGLTSGHNFQSAWAERAVQTIFKLDPTEGIRATKPDDEEATSESAALEALIH